MRTNNWWVRWIMEVWTDADYAWTAHMEEETMMYATEMAEFRERHPRPTLKETMIGLKGVGARP